jgi:hypothetical protein
MITRHFRLTAIGCALSWFLLGLHLPTVHEVVDHGYSPHWTVATMVALLALASVASLWALLRAPARGAT